MTSLQDLGDHSHHCLHVSLDDEFCLLPSDLLDSHCLRTYRSRLSGCPHPWTTQIPLPEPPAHQSHFLPMYTGRQIAFMTHASLEIKDVPRRVTGMSDSASSWSVAISKKIIELWENIVMALEKEPEAVVTNVFGRPAATFGRAGKRPEDPISKQSPAAMSCAADGGRTSGSADLKAPWPLWLNGLCSDDTRRIRNSHLPVTIGLGSCECSSKSRRFSRQVSRALRSRSKLAFNKELMAARCKGGTAVADRDEAWPFLMAQSRDIAPGTNHTPSPTLQKCCKTTTSI